MWCRPRAETMAKAALYVAMKDAGITKVLGWAVTTLER
jgi:hypothetical protein